MPNVKDNKTKHDLSELYNAPIVWLGVTCFVNEISKYTAAVHAINEIKEDAAKEAWPNNEYLELADEAIWRQLISNITKVFDNDNTCRHDNCSLKMLKNLCIEDKDKFPDGEMDLLLQALEVLYKNFDSTISVEIRNKNVAHHDLIDLFTGEIKYINFSDVESLVEETIDLISKIGEKLFLPFVFPPIPSLTEKFKTALLELIKAVDRPHE